MTHQSPNNITSKDPSNKLNMLMMKQGVPGGWRWKSALNTRYLTHPPLVDAHGYAAASNRQLKQSSAQPGKSLRAVRSIHPSRAGSVSYTIRKPRVRYGRRTRNATCGRSVVFNQPGTRSTNRADLPAPKGTGRELEGSLACAHLQCQEILSNLLHRRIIEI